LTIMERLPERQNFMSSTMAMSSMIIWS